MDSLGKTITLILVLIITFSTPISKPFGLAQTATNESGVIYSDTTWTEASSPYSLAGPVAVNQGVTLTIEPGTTINLNNYYIQVNGTLVAKGTSASQIQFIGGSTIGITFTSLSNNWNEQTGSGCIIQNAIIEPNLQIFESSVKIDHSTVSGSFTVGGSSIVTDNNLTGGASVLGSATLSNNIISGTLSNGPGAVVPVVSVSSGSSPNSLPTIANNQIYGSPNSDETSNIGIACNGYASIINNTLTGCEEGIRIYSSQTTGFPIIKQNVINNNQAGIVIQASESAQSPASNSPLIEENLITNNTNGISVEAYGGIVTPAILNNNIYQNSHNLSWELPNNIDVTNNWWGTTDLQAINATIYDNKNDFNLGTVNFVPFLTAPNPQAPNLNTPMPTPSPSSSPTPTVISTSSTPSTPEFPSAICLILIIITSTIGILAYRRKLKHPLFSCYSFNLVDDET
ncbi:MAG: hypothetical protein ABSG33_12115 [Candidatus Bathyarchaeia archaeon]